MSNFYQYILLLCLTVGTVVSISGQPPPSNDEKNAAISIAVNDSPNCNQKVTVSMDKATASTDVNCGADYGDFPHDVWYEFVANDELLHMLIFNFPNEIDIDIQVTASNPSSYMECYFFNTIAGAPDPLILMENLISGNTYYVRVSPYENEASYTFDLCLKKYFPPNPHDECSIAQELNAANSYCSSLSILGASASSQLSNCFNENNSLNFNDDVWVKFNAFDTEQQIDVSNIVNATGGSVDLIYEIMEGSCSSAVSIHCQDEPEDIVAFSNLTIGQDYYIRIASSSILTQDIDFDICVSSYNLSPPPNDDCVDAIVLTEGTCKSGNLAGATHSNESYECGIDASHADIWYNFTAQESSHLLEFKNILNTQSGDILSFELLKGNTCGALSSIRCTSFSLSYVYDDLEVGSTYYVRVTSAKGIGSIMTFDICLSSSCSLMVSNTSASGGGSLRSMIDCASDGDNIEFASALDNSTINLSSPSIVISKSVNLICDPDRNITISNQSNTSILIDINAPTNITGLLLKGSPDNSMFFNVGDQGDLNIINTQLENVTVSTN